MNVTTDRTNLVEIKNHNINKNILLNSSSIVFKNKLLEQKKYHSNAFIQNNDQNILETNDENSNDDNFNDKQNKLNLLMEEIDILKFIKHTPPGLKLMKIMQD